MLCRARRVIVPHAPSVAAPGEDGEPEWATLVAIRAAIVAMASAAAADAATTARGRDDDDDADEGVAARLARAEPAQRPAPPPPVGVEVAHDNARLVALIRTGPDTWDADYYAKQLQLGMTRALCLGRGTAEIRIDAPANGTRVRVVAARAAAAPGGDACAEEAAAADGGETATAPAEDAARTESPASAEDAASGEDAASAEDAEDPSPDDDDDDDDDVDVAQVGDGDGGSAAVDVGDAYYYVRFAVEITDFWVARDGFWCLYANSNLLLCVLQPQLRLVVRVPRRGGGGAAAAAAADSAADPAAAASAAAHDSGDGDGDGRSGGEGNDDDDDGGGVASGGEGEEDDDDGRQREGDEDDARSAQQAERRSPTGSIYECLFEAKLRSNIYGDVLRTSNSVNITFELPDAAAEPSMEAETAAASSSSSDASEGTSAETFGPPRARSGEPEFDPRTTLMTTLTPLMLEDLCTRRR